MDVRVDEHVIIAIPFGLEFVVAVHACLYFGIVPIVIPPFDIDRAEYDAAILVQLCSTYNVVKILTDGEYEDVLRNKQFQSEIKNSRKRLEITSSFPDLLSTSKAPKNSKLAMNENLHADAITGTISSTNNRLVQVHVLGNQSFETTGLSHDTILSQCILLKESCNIISGRPLLVCGRSNHFGLGFLYSTIVGIFSGCKTIDLKANDFGKNPNLFLDLISKHQIKDSIITCNLFVFADT
jgi:hypothetical protein